LVHELRGNAPAAKANGKKVTYHDSCHLKRSLGIHKEQRELITKGAGYDLVEMNGSDICCGMGGSYMAKHPEISKPILELKMKNVEETGAEIVGVDCPGCMLQIGGGLHKKNSPIKVKHTAQLLAEKLDEKYKK
ncbi:Fe-S oxidoreductase, partial [Desulfitispora alkaliphila]|uniref:(Fe-S)-binding protein n=1 Tax=Desulfitispora alkaliphila TaxID=622674 RepID=UPI003D1B4AE3